MLTRTEKEQIVENLAGVLQDKKPVIFANYQGTKMENIAAWRKNLPPDFQFQIIKNTLLKLSAKKAGVELNDEIFGQPVSILIGKDDEIEATKLPFQWSGEAETFQILGGVINGQFVNADEVIKLAKLPGREILEAQLVWSMKSLLFRLTNALAYNGRALTVILRRIAAK